jgi:DNA-binding NarL/FixJ family response regulator
VKRHVFMTARPEPVPRWLEAFPDALFMGYRVADGTELAPLADAAVVWLHVAGNEQAVAAWVGAVRAVAPGVPVVVLSNVPEDEQAMAALAAGAAGYCSALALPAVLRQVAGVVEHGGVWVGPQLMHRLMQGLSARKPDGPAAVLDGLSQRERQVAQAVARGSTNKEIARVLGITERTVKAHLSAVFGKLGVRDRIQLSLLVNGVEDSTPTPQKIPA